MTSPEVAAYLAATRGGGCLTGASAPLVEFYRQTFDAVVDTLRALLRVEIEPPPLVVVYSAIGHAETVVVRGRPHLVYDQYLGQMLNRLNRLYFEDAGGNEMNAYLHKVYASRSLAVGRPDRAVAHATAHGVLAEHLTNAVHDESGMLRASYTAWQEMFVIAHELVHYVFRAYPRAADAFRRYCVELVTIVADDLDGTARTERFAAASASFVESMSGDDTPASSGLPAELTELPELADFRMDLQGLAFGADAFDPLTNAVVLEECVCDSAALMVTSIAATGDGRVADAACAAFLGLHHLRLIRMADAAIARIDATDDGVPKIVGETQYRFSFFRSMARALRDTLWSPLPEEMQRPTATFLDAGTLMMALVEVNDHYDEIFWRADAVAGSYAQLREALRAADTVVTDGAEAHDFVRAVCNLPQT